MEPRKRRLRDGRTCPPPSFEFKYSNLVALDALVLAVLGDIQVGLIKTRGLETRVEVVEDPPGASAAFCVPLEVARDKDQLGAQDLADEP